MSEPEELASVKDQATGDKDEKNIKSQADDSEKEEVFISCMEHLVLKQWT